MSSSAVIVGFRHPVRPQDAAGRMLRLCALNGEFKKRVLVEHCQ